jgi:hypothetical protein
VKLKDIADRMALKSFHSEGNIDVEVSGGYTCDLLSDVVGNSEERNVWITCQTHENIIAVAKLKALAAIVLVNGRKPDGEALERAREERIVIFGTPKSAFAISGALWVLLNAPKD